MKKILFICNDTLKNSGWSTYTLDLADSLSQKGYSVNIACCKSENNRDLSLKVFHDLSDPNRLMRSPIQFLNSLLKIRKIIKLVKPEIIHITVEPYVMLLPFLNTKNIK